MKGGVAAILAAVRALGAAGDLERLDGELLVALVPSEEDGGQGTLAAIRAGVTGDLAIIPEPSNLDVVVAHAGAITFRLTVPGRAAHASQRREGVSALDKLFVLAEALEADEARRNDGRDRPADDRARPAVPDDHRHRVGRGVGVDRARPGHRRRPVRRPARPVGGRRRGRAAGVRSRPRAPRTTSCATTRRPSRSPAAGSGRRGCRRITRCRSGWRDVAERVTGRRPALLGEPYGADMQMFVNVGGTPCVIFGPGDVKVAHSADEHVPLDEVEACARGPGGLGRAGADRGLTARPLRPRATSDAPSGQRERDRDDDQRRADEAQRPRSRPRP